MKIRPEYILMADDHSAGAMLLMAALREHKEHGGYTIFVTDGVSDEEIADAYKREGCKFQPDNFFVEDELGDLSSTVEELRESGASESNIRVFIDAGTNFILVTDRSGARVKVDSGGELDDKELQWLDNNCVIRGVTVYNWSN